MVRIPLVDSLLTEIHNGDRDVGTFVRDDAARGTPNVPRPDTTDLLDHGRHHCWSSVTGCYCKAKKVNLFI